MVFAVNAVKTQKNTTPRTSKECLLAALALCSFFSAGNATWFTLQNILRDVISLVAYHAHRIIF
jgi:hypothetical protein